MSVGFYPARDYLLLVDFGVVILIDEQVDAMSDSLPTLRDVLCSFEMYLGVAGAKVVSSVCI